MNKKIILGILLILMLVLTSCTSGVLQSRYRYGDNPDYYVGFEGVELYFVEQAPPDTMFEDSPFDLQAEIYNKGAYDVVSTEESVKQVEVEFVIDSADLLPVSVSGPGGDIYTFKDDIQLFGRSYYYPEGERDYFALDRYAARNIIGNFERNTAELFVTLCYPYRTYFSDLFCVDTDTSDTGLRDQVCNQEDKKYTKGQGAPVAITAVESNIFPRGAYVEPQYMIHIEHRGEGIVSLYNTSNEGQYQCSSITPDNVNKMELQATLGNDTLECYPNPVFFRDGEAKVECRLPNSEILSVAPNYMTALNVQLYYLYTETYQREITIKRKESSAFYLRPIVSEEDECPPWGVYVGEECISRCLYCSENPTSSECIVNDYQEKNPTKPKEFSQYSSCVYDAQDCSKAGDGCIRENGVFCMPGTYCGIPSCAYSAISNGAPDPVLDPSYSSEITWYCRDRQNTGELLHACGCTETSSYMPFESGTSCPPIGSSEYKDVQGTYSLGLKRMYFSIPSDDVNTTADGICVVVSDNQGKQVVKKLRFT